MDPTLHCVHTTATIRSIISLNMSHRPKCDQNDDKISLRTWYRITRAYTVKQALLSGSLLMPLY